MLTEEESRELEKAVEDEKKREIENEKFEKTWAIKYADIYYEGKLAP